MEKIDLTTTDPSYYKGKAQPSMATFGPHGYVTLSGKGDPNGAGFAQDVQALYAVAYTVKMASKKSGADFGVAKLEGDWSADNPPLDKDIHDVRDCWTYKLRIRLPEFIEAGAVEEAALTAATKKKIDRTKDVTLETITDGTCVQALHTGPYATERETIEKMTAVAQEHAYRRSGYSHIEIYLCDPRKTAPEKLKTLLRLQLSPQ